MTKTTIHSPSNDQSNLHLSMWDHSCKLDDQHGKSK